MEAGLRSAAQGIGSVSIMCYTCPELATVMLSIVPPMAIGATIYGRYVKSLSKDVQARLAETSEKAEERISHIRTVKLFFNEHR